MKMADLSPETTENINSYRWDRIIEKHEGPESWRSVLAYYDPEFLEIGGRSVLLPVGRDQHPHITILRCIVSEDGRNLTIFLKDRTFVQNQGDTLAPRDEMFYTGFVSVCERFPGEKFFIAILYHEWFIIEN